MPAKKRKKKHAKREERGMKEARKSEKAKSVCRKEIVCGGGGARQADRERQQGVLWGGGMKGKEKGKSKEKPFIGREGKAGSR